jgi:4-diphosphocytidyl-2-C-methyl-D-erythritol kinase
MQVTLKAHAKVNLGLRVLGRRADGYHELLTVMQPLDLADELTVEEKRVGLEFICDHPGLRQGNLVEKAALDYFAALGMPPAVRLELRKGIPVASGLGGGSADAAAALLGLNVLNRGALPAEELLKLARGLGADVAFCLGGVTALAAGVGDRLTPWPDFPLLHYVLLNPGVAISTAWVYNQFDLTWTKTRAGFNINRFSTCLRSWEDILVNDLEEVSLGAYPQLSGIKQALLEAGARFALMSGSGPTVFGVFAGESAARDTAERLGARQGWWIRVCRGVMA